MATKLETSIETDDATVATMGSEPSATTTNSDATSVEISRDTKKVVEGLEKEGIEPAEATETEVEGETEKEAAAGDLGEWKAGDPETQAKFDARYFNKDGELDRAALTTEFYANAKEGVAGALNEATYAYLKDTLGVTKEFVNEVEAGLVAASLKVATEFYGKFGGQERFEAAVKWGREGGYTEAQRARFNELRKKGGADFEDATEALMARYAKAHPEAGSARRGPPTGRNRNSSPERTTTGGAAGEGGAGGRSGDVFKTASEYQEAWQDGIKQQRAAVSATAKREAKEKLDALRAKAKRSNLRFG